MFKWTVTAEHTDMLLREFLQHHALLSRSLVKVLKFDGGSILVNGKQESVRRRLAIGDTVQVIFPPEQRGPQVKPENMDLDILFEDDLFMVIDKPPRIATIPSAQHPTGTIANAVVHYYDQNKLPYTFHVVTRLDRDTSGLMLIAKHRYAHSLMATHKIERGYHAVVSGHLASKKGVINAPIARKPGSIIERTVAAAGKHAITHYQVVNELSDYSLVQIRLETGRTHQIRVHFAYLAHPLLGDNLYGGDCTVISRQALHCSSLQFMHPVSHEVIALSAPIPSDINRLLQDVSTALKND
ncbi:23S rRNA pseudouridine1911/1915/1917 synthase [Amphibacillus marinus]|uniref:Pseudouridine synthase n=1 Tax=Amphibacillus marinus TaxID=872970 RepID=A0A1H8QAQ1_9BACI|nr:RluA family pseudouridine synthase [Amphibacillus marinus]SEO51088.1 23S rRNA pseudouridine1911/1915/1917 synthase [Amphibacillus marinus]